MYYVLVTQMSVEDDDVESKIPNSNSRFFVTETNIHCVNGNQLENRT